MKWDLFISHASEDKESFVKPLVKALEEYGLTVWYDEFELKIGDSLSSSIDKGIINSENGLIIISKAFLEKNWTDYELKSLITKEVNQSKSLLPIWHNVTKEEVMEKSLFLADKFALSSDIGINKLAIKIVEKVRPDIINSTILKAVVNKSMKSNTSMPQKLNPESIEKGNIVHESLPNHIIMSSLLITQILSDVLDMNFKDFITDLARDWDYNREYFVWNVITYSYLLFIKNNNIKFDDIEKKKEVISDLLQLSLGEVEVHYLSDDEFNILI